MLKFTYDESSGTVLMLNFRFNAMMRDLLRREMIPTEEPVKKEEAGEGEEAGEIQYLPRFGDYLGKLERLFNITVMKTDYVPEMMLMVVYVPREELPQEEVDMRCVEYASHGLPYHTNYTGKDLNRVDRFVAMLRRQFSGSGRTACPSTKHLEGEARRGSIPRRSGESSARRRRGAGGKLGLGRSCGRGAPRST